MSDFELNKLDWFTVQNVEENDFLNDKLENDQFGIFYSVKFQGDASTHLWQAKSKPVEGQKYYGHLELTKSGKSTKFKRAKREDTPQENDHGNSQSNTNGYKSQYQPRDDLAIRAQWAIGQAVRLAQNREHVDDAALEAQAKVFYAMIDRVKGSSESTDPKGQITTGTTTPSSSGYDKFKASKPTSQNPDPEFASMLAKGMEADGITQEELDSIPY